MTKPTANTIIKNVADNKEKIQPNPELRVNIGKFMLDLSKLTFASFILGGILKGELPQYIIIAAGGVVFTVLTVIGMILSSQKKERR